MYQPRRYVGLSIVMVASFVFTGIVTASFLLSLESIFSATDAMDSAFKDYPEFPQPNGSLVATAYRMAFLSLIAHGTAFIFFLAIAQGAKVLNDIQSDTHQTAYYAAKTFGKESPTDIGSSTDPTEINE